MKPTTKVSIGGLAFTLEEDAFEAINKYLQDLDKHFENNAEKKEIIADIESRMSELLMMRINNSEHTVSLEDAKQIIAIMGNPKDFGDDENAHDTENKNSNFDKKESSTADSNTFRKRLYRDTEHKLISGICSGLAYYLKIDPVVVRLLCVLALIGLYMISFKSGMLLVLFYAALSFIIPKAKSFEEKVSMTGTNPSIEDIEYRVQNTNSKYKGSIIGDVLRVIIKIFLVIIAVVLGIAILAIFISLTWLFVESDVFDISNLLLVSGLDTINFKIALLALCVLPLVGLFSLIVKMVSSSRFTKSTLLFFISGLLIWIGSIAYLSTTALSFAKNVKNVATASMDIPVKAMHTSLYVKLGDEYNNAENQPQIDDMYYTDSEGKRVFYILPEIHIEENSDSLLNNVIVTIHKTAYGKTHKSAEQKLENIEKIVLVNDSLIIINPEWYSADTPWRKEKTTITITKPAGVSVSTAAPLSVTYLISIHNNIKMDFPLSFNVGRGHGRRYNHSSWDDWGDDD